MSQAESIAPEKAQTGITVTLALAMLLASLGTSIANIALPTLAASFAAPFDQVRAVVVAYLAALTATVLVAGRLGDRHGHKPILLTGLVVFAAGTLLCAAAPALWLLVGARAVQGLGAAFLMTLAMALMRRTTNEARIGRAMGLLGAVSALGTALGPALGGLLIPVAGWRGIFWAQLPLAALALALAVLTLPSESRAGSVSSSNLWSVLNRQSAPGLVVNALVAAVMMTTLVVGPFYLDLGLGLDAWQVGLVMTVGPVISIASGVPSGRLVDNWGSERALVLGLLLLIAGALLMAFAPAMMGVTGYIVSLGGPDAGLSAVSGGQQYSRPVCND